MIPIYKDYTRFLLYACLGLFMMGSGLLGCKCSQNTKNDDYPKGKPGQVSNSANMLLSSAMSDSAIQNKFIAAIPTLKPADINIRRCHCDEKLLSISLPKNWTITGSGDPLHVNPPTGGEGLVSLPITKDAVGNNFSVSAFVPREEQPYSGSPVVGKTTIPIATAIKPAVKIAIFDSGLQAGYLPSVTQGLSTSICTVPVKTSTVGWNFMPGGTIDNPIDDYPQRHGSRVAYLVARQFEGQSIPVNITPFKVLDSALKGDLFGLLCAMETARKNGFTVFNISLGYYGAEDNLFKRYISRATKDGVWIVAAAGNHYNDGKPVPTDTTRNLSARADTSKFYPAWFAKSNDRVIAVTTAHLENSSVLVGCQGQNYDKNHVVGVEEDRDCQFSCKVEGSGVFIRGTSYATPALTGWLGSRSTVRTANRNTLLNGLTQAATGSQLYQNRYLKKPIP